jgi:hypothetical protein
MSVVFSVVTLCDFVGGYQHCGGCIGSNMFLQTFDNHVQDCCVTTQKTTIISFTAIRTSDLSLVH